MVARFLFGRRAGPEQLPSLQSLLPVVENIERFVCLRAVGCPRLSHDAIRDSG